MSRSPAIARLVSWFLPEEYRAERLCSLFWPRVHPPLIATRRNELIASRVRALAVIFGILTLLWIPIDLLTLPLRTAALLTVGRLAAGGAFAYLASLTRRPPSAGRIYRSLVVLYAVPTVFYFASLMLLRQPGLGPYARTALEAYWALPIVAMAGLGIFPLTVLETVLFSVPIVVGEIMALSLHLGVFFPGGIVDAAWMMFLMAGIAIFVGISQLNFTIALVGQSLRDPLTGCYSRGSVSEMLDLHFKVCARVDSPLAVAFLDLDRFKAINDTFGHDAGDRVLVAAARAIQAALRGTQCVGRWGGEEFIVIFPGETAAEAIDSIERLRRAGLGQSPDGRPVTVSVGVAERITDRCGAWPSLVRVADQRMYAAKSAGRDCLAGPEDDESTDSGSPVLAWDRVIA